MFLRRYTRSQDGKEHPYYALLESIRTMPDPGNIRQPVGIASWLGPGRAPRIPRKLGGRSV
jgi:hypothetical protein